MDQERAYDLIVTIVNKGDSERVVEASRKSGAEGGTILSGRGTGIHERAKLFGLTIEPEKDCLLYTSHNSGVVDQNINPAKFFHRGVD